MRLYGESTILMFQDFRNFVESTDQLADEEMYNVDLPAHIWSMLQFLQLGSLACLSRNKIRYLQPILIRFPHYDRQLVAVQM